MSSGVPRYEYDIFISYRQNDNRSRWVTEFVRQLEQELTATIKFPVSVYFDANPHDGLLETHDVDKSLAGKLNSFILIPILSQTYCDPTSFAWRNEFCAFNKIASAEPMGRDILLLSGNVASRILPVTIHELDAEDLDALKNELGGALRAVEFIYKAPGVNRPLLPHEEHPADNQNRTFYRDQVNKVANAVKERIMAARKPVKDVTPGKMAPTHVAPGRSVLKIGAASLLIVATIFLISRFYSTRWRETTIKPIASVAILPFENLSNDPGQEYFCDGITEQVISSLARLVNLKVIARTSVQQYKGTTKTIAQIAAELGVTHVLESSVRKSGDRIRITAQLIAAKDESHLWAEDFEDKAIADVFEIQDKVATRIAESLRSRLMPEESKRLRSERPSDPRAYEHYLKGEYFAESFNFTLRNGDFVMAEREFKTAIRFDLQYASPRAALSDLYDSKANAIPTGEERKHYMDTSAVLAFQAYGLNPGLPYALLVKFQALFQDDLQYDSAYKYIRLAYEASPSDAKICGEFGTFFQYIGLSDQALIFLTKARELSPANSRRYNMLAVYYQSRGDYKSAKENLMQALLLEPRNAYALGNLFTLNISTGNLVAADSVLQRIKAKNPDKSAPYFDALLLAAKGEKDNALALSQDINVYLLLKDKQIVLDQLEKGNLPTYARLDSPWYRYLRTESRFKALMEKAKAVYDDRVKKYGQLNLPQDAP